LTAVPERNPGRLFYLNTVVRSFTAFMKLQRSLAVRIRTPDYLFYLPKSKIILILGNRCGIIPTL